MRRIVWPLVFASCAFGAAPAIAVTIRPGAAANGCTLGFVFGADDGYRYVGLAGHCFVDDGTQRTWPAGSGPAALLSNGSRIGRAVYAIWNQDALNPQPIASNPALAAAADFALVRLDPTVVANPSVCHFGGPVGVDSHTGLAPRVVRYYGNGLAVGRLGQTLVLPARSGVAIGFGDVRQVRLIGAISSGDSGMPVLDGSGRAVGWLSHLGNPLGYSSPAPVVRIAPNVALAEHAVGIRLRLLTAPWLAGATPFGRDGCP